MPAPVALRKYLRFARLPAPALDIARRVLEDDPDFRQRVASALSEAQVGEAGWLWLTRPEGWEERVEDLRREAQDAEAAEREQRADRDAHRRLAHAEDRARRAEALLADRERALETARTELSEERQSRRAREVELAAATDTLAHLREERHAAVRRFKEIEAELAQRTAELRQARHGLRQRDAELAASVAPDPTPQMTPPEPVPVPAEPPLDRAALAHLVAQAAQAAHQLSAALGSASGLLSPAPAVPEAPRASPARPPVRVAARLPGGVLADSVEAADHLLRLEGAMLLVDGYNVSISAWPDLPIALQRVRLVDALTELHARTLVEVEVVFDGAETGMPSGLPAAARAGVRVRFSPPSTEADDVVLERIDTLAARRVVVVASSDRRVQEGARRRGAYVIAANQLLGALRR